MLMNTKYNAGFQDVNEETLQADGSVRVYGTWKGTYALQQERRVCLNGMQFFRYDAEGKIAHYMEWYDSADLSKEFD